MRCSAFGGQPCQWPCAPVISRARKAAAGRRPGELRRELARARPSARQRSVPEVPHAGEHHRDAALVGGGDHLVVAHRCRRAGSRRSRRRRPPRRARRGTGRRRRSPPPSPAATGPACSALMLAMRAESRRLIWPGADAQRHAAGAEHDRVALHVLGDLPGEQQVVHLLRRRLLLASRPSARRSVSSRLSAVCISRPEPTRLTSWRCGRVPGGLRPAAARSAARARSPWPRTPPAPRR